ncbi:hypothetical protein ACFLUB_03530 [Chloroflexota bacterium]
MEEKIRDKSAKVGIVGLSYVGIPLAITFSETGFRIIGFDVDQKSVDLINQGSEMV